MTGLHEVVVDGAVLSAQWQLAAGGSEASGPAPLVFLHAGVADGRMWQGQWDAFSPGRSVLRYDRRGFGASRTLAPTPHSRVADLWAVMDAAGLQRAVLVGCSQGGRLAMDAALARPDRVQGLVLVAPAVGGAPPFEVDEPTKSLDEAADAAIAAGELQRANDLQAHLWLDGPAGPVGRVGGAARATFFAMNTIALHAADPGPVLEAPPAWPRLGEITVPTRVLCGDLDLPLLLTLCEQLAQKIPGARYEMLPGLAHLPSLESPAAFNAALKGFVESSVDAV